MKKYNMIALAGVISLLSLTACTQQDKYALNSTMPRTVGGAAANPTKNTSQITQAKLQKDSYYFGLDDAKTKDANLANLAKHANNLTHSNVKAKIAGHADERGSDAYNYDLGKKRAEFVAEQLVKLGVPRTNLEIVSYGKTKPLATAHNETSWQENRRVDVVYLS